MAGKKDIKVAELFAGVGGFRVGLEKASKKDFKIVWSNQWEPATKRQHASEVYVKNFGEKGHSNEDIAKVPTGSIPDHDLLVGGFPCQDYSVARTLSQAAGLAGKKGVLWWQIHRILKEKGTRRPKYLLLENVDRLLKSPADQRGRDFGIMLASLADLGYAVEWRVINAADYGMPQRRRRVFILGYREGTKAYGSLSRNMEEWLLKKGTAIGAFPAEVLTKKPGFAIVGTLAELTQHFNKSHPDKSPFLNSGVMSKREVLSYELRPRYSGERQTLRSILDSRQEVSKDFFIESAKIEAWKRLKGAKKDSRKTKDGFSYSYSEGAMAFPDPLDKPSRTIVTGEGGSTPSRFKHVIEVSPGTYRRLTPTELERLCMFEPGHTQGEGITDARRAFFMGNALVVGVITRLGKALLRNV